MPGSAEPITPQLDGPTFERVRAVVLDAAGIALGDKRASMVSARLAKRLVATGHDDVGAYLDFVDREGAAERQALISAMTTNVTQFFREAHHFDRLAAAATAAFRAGRPMRVWSAGCSTGQEPYSIALTLAQAGFSASDARVLAVDIDHAVLHRAMTARYAPRELDSLTLAARKRGIKVEAGASALSGEVRRMVEFKPLNLTGHWPMRTRFDAIFCRNVAIYFDPRTQGQLWRRMIGALKPGGLLFIGHSERLPDELSGQVSACGQTTYLKGEGPEGDGIR